MLKKLEQAEIKSLRFDGVSFSYLGQDPILKNVDFEFVTEKINWIKSSDGAGKSSLLQLLAGLNMPTSGKYLINGENIVEMSFEEFLPLRLAIGYSFDYGGLISNRTLYDNLMLPLVYHKIIDYDEAAKRVDDLVVRFELKRYIQERPAHVPGRARKLVCLLRALVIHPHMVIMDDPSVGLGFETQEILVHYIKELRSKKLAEHFFLSSYDDKFISFFETESVFLEDGQLYHQPQDLQLLQEKKLVNV